MKIKYDFSVSQDWIEGSLKFTQCVCSQGNLDMNQILDNLDDFGMFAAGFDDSKKNIAYWLIQNERNLGKYGEIDWRTVTMDVDLAYGMLDSYRDVANKYGLALDDGIYYNIRIEIVALRTEA